MLFTRAGVATQKLFGSRHALAHRHTHTHIGREAGRQSETGTHKKEGKEKEREERDTQTEEAETAPRQKKLPRLQNNTVEWPKYTGRKR